MTVGPLTVKPEELRPFSRLTRRLFDQMASPGTARMTTLAIEMSDSRGASIEEGANMLRIGSAFFGQRS